MSYLTDQREALAVALAGDSLTVAPTLDTMGALPALVVRPAVAWLTFDASGGGPASVGVLEMTAVVVTTGADPAAAWAAMEQELDGVLERLPPHWRPLSVAGPAPLMWGAVAAWFSEVTVSKSVNVR